MNHTKICTADLDSPCREFSNGGLGFVVAFLVFWGINFSCASTRNPIQLYSQTQQSNDKGVVVGDLT